MLFYAVVNTQIYCHCDGILDVISNLKQPSPTAVYIGPITYRIRRK